jgi:hypothetical protein
MLRPFYSECHHIMAEGRIELLALLNKRWYIQSTETDNSSHNGRWDVFLKSSTIHTTFALRFHGNSPTAFCIFRGETSTVHYCLQSRYQALKGCTVSWLNELHLLVNTYYSSSLTLRANLWKRETGARNLFLTIDIMACASRTDR